jgi:hypothetical protein
MQKVTIKSNLFLPNYQITWNHISEVPNYISEFQKNGLYLNPGMVEDGSCYKSSVDSSNSTLTAALGSFHPAGELCFAPLHQAPYWYLRDGSWTALVKPSWSRWRGASWIQYCSGNWKLLRRQWRWEKIRRWRRRREQMARQWRRTEKAWRRWRERGFDRRRIQTFHRSLIGAREIIRPGSVR